MKKVLIPLASGCEEMEAVTIIDILRRGGIQVITAGIQQGPIKASRGVVLLADTLLEEAIAADDFDMVVIPGGMEGAQALMECERFVAFVRRMVDKGRIVGAICAAPMILGKAGVLAGKKFTAYPGVIDANQFPGSTYTNATVEKDKGILTSRGPGTALDFALTLLEELVDNKTRIKVEQQLVRS